MNTNLILRSLDLDNFAGSKKEHHTFYDQITTVEADNGVGKTRLENAVNYLLFDKNAEDRKDFNIKNTVDLSANRQEHIVAGVFELNNSEISLKKIYREKWTKKQGSLSQEMTGHETVYYFNDVPVLKNEYKVKIDAIINESLFRLITNITFFNKLPFLKQREIILGLVPQVKDTDIADTNPEFQKLLTHLNNGKTITELKAQLAGQKKKLNEELKAIPVRIDEVKKSLPEQEDFAELEKELQGLASKVAAIEAQLNNEQEQQNQLNQERQRKQQIINNLKLKKQELEFKLEEAEAEKANAHSSKKRECKTNIENTQKDVNSTEKEAQRLIDEITAIDGKLAELRETFKQVNSNEPEISDSADEYTCPTCGAQTVEEYSEAKKEDLLQVFKTSKAKTLELINKRGAELTEEKHRLWDELGAANEAFDLASSQLAGYKAELNRLEKLECNLVPTAKTPELIALETEILLLESAIETIEPVDQSELNSKKTELNTAIDALKLRINNKNIIATGNKRIAELAMQESDYAQQVFDLEAIEYTISEFDKAKINAVEGPVNAKFERVKFKLFHTQVNGAEVPVCEATYLGVPYSDLSTAQKIIAGLDIIKTLCREYKVYAPIFIDNAESITDIPVMDSQVIKLQVKKGLKTLIFS